MLWCIARVSGESKPHVAQLRGRHMQKSIIVRYRYREEPTDRALEELNDLLREGWHVVTMAPMGGAPINTRNNKGPAAIFASLVVLER